MNWAKLAFNITWLKEIYIDIKEDFHQWFIFFFDKKSSGSVVKSEIILNQESAEELHKQSENLKNEDNRWGADLADMQLISKYNNHFMFYYISSMFSVITHGFSLLKKERVLQLPVLFKKF